MGSLLMGCRFFPVLGLLFLIVFTPAVFASDRPNILLAISDDQSFYHTSKAGYPPSRHRPSTGSRMKASTSPMP